MKEYFKNALIICAEMTLLVVCWGLAEMAWIFYTAIRNAGADVPEAAMLTQEYLIASIHGKSNAAPEGE